MELDELKTIWIDYDKKLEKTLQLNMQLLKKMNFDKMQRKGRTLLAMKLVELLIYLYLLFYLANFTVKYLAQIQFSLSGGLLWVIVLAGLISVVRQISLTVQLNNDLNIAIAPLQKKIATLKMQIVRYIKYSMFMIPLYPVLVIVFGKIFLHVDFTQPQRAAYFYSNVAVGVALLPISIWLFIELSRKEIVKPWVKQLLIGSGWFQANAAQQFLLEIETFEQE